APSAGAVDHRRARGHPRRPAGRFPGGGGRRMVELNDTIAVPVRRVSPLAKRFPPPSYATAGPAGLDLRACLAEPVTLAPGERRLIPTGIAIALPSPQLVALVFARSGLASRHGIQLANGVGVIDSDYRGEILCALQNAGREPFTV